MNPNRAQHAFIWGDSGSGKTTLLREIHDKCAGPSIIVDHGFDGSDASKLDGFKGFIAAGEKRCRSIVGEYSSWQDVRIVYRSEAQEPKTAVARAMRFARDLPVGCQIIIDELDEVMPNDDSTAKENAAKWGYRKGRGAGVKVVGATQSPVGLDQDALRSTRWWCCVGQPSGFHEQFLNRHQWIPREELPDRDFRFVVWNKQGAVVYRGETKPEYA